MRKIFFCAITLLLFAKLHAQVMPFKNYGITDGLNDNNVQAVARDDRGLLWIGTDFGVSWFDGKKFYSPPMKTNIGQLYVNGFYKDPDGAMWVLTFFNGIYRYKNGLFTNYLIDNKSKDAITNSASGMIQVSPGKYIVISQESTYLFDRGKFSVFDPGNTGLKNKTNDVTQLADKTILLATDSGIFLYRYDNGKAKLIGHVLKSLQTNKILATKTSVWVTTGEGLMSFNNSGLSSFANTPKSYLPKKLLQYITADKDETIWALSDNGSYWSATDTVFKIKGGKITQYTSANGLPENIQQIYCDNEGLVWFANRKGLGMLGDEYYEFSSLKLGGYDEPVSALFMDQQNNLWAGCINGVAVRKDNGYAFYRSIAGQPIDYVAWFKQNADASFSMGSISGVFNVKNGAMKKQFGLQATSICNNTDDDTWFGCKTGEIWRYNGHALIPLKTDRPVPEMIVALYVKGDYLWVGYRDRGIVKYKINNDRLLKVKEFTAATGNTDMRIRSCVTDKKGNILWGTRTNGLFVFNLSNNRQMAHLTIQNGLNANWIKDIKCDTDGKLYLATNNGINIVSGNYDDPSVKYLKINNDNINRETNCIIKAGDIFYVGTNEGVLKWMPQNNRRDTVSPPVYFTKIIIQGLKRFSVIPYTVNAGAITLPYDEHSLQFEFAGVSLKNPENVKYRYKLEVQNNEWGPITELNNVAYNLTPGNYAFKVIAENADGVWSRVPAVFYFVIRPPFWYSWWFITLVIITITLAAYIAYRYKLSKMLALELLRNKISTDLHDDIGSTLSSIAILSEVALRQEEKKSKRILGEINERSHMLMEKMDDIVWSISSKNDTVGNLFIRVQQFASTVLEAKDIDYDVQVPERVKEMKVDMQRRQHIYLILKEAINNVIKYAQCTRVTITAEYIGDTLKIIIADNGKGFDERTIQYGNGLYNMRNRTEAMHGILSVHSVPGNGTRVILSVEIE